MLNVDVGGVGSCWPLFLLISDNKRRGWLLLTSFVFAFGTGMLPWMIEVLGSRSTLLIILLSYLCCSRDYVFILHYLKFLFDMLYLIMKFLFNKKVGHFYRSFLIC